PLMRKLGLVEGELIIEGGLFDAHHSLTPSDKEETLIWYEGSYVPQTTGFGDAAGVVYPVAGIGNLKAATGRYYSFRKFGDLWVNGASQFSLSMTISVPKKKAARIGLDPQKLRSLIGQGLFEAAFDSEGRKHIGIINPSVFTHKDNKKVGSFTLASLTGMTPTTMLPLNDNIDVVQVDGTLVKYFKVVDDKGKPVLDGKGKEKFVSKEFATYIVTVKNAAYDNRLGFTADWMEEVNRVAEGNHLAQPFPGFDHQVDLRDELAFIRTPEGREAYKIALDKSKGEILLGHQL
ncbi:MAG: hypothetical protein PHH14_04560, partial [Candidatus Margulisbacteria bacterium]|nr:hypothetical protein [Candidatus Margulisiibacteriota bacterium]